MKRLCSNGCGRAISYEMRGANRWRTSRIDHDLCPRCWQAERTAQGVASMWSRASSAKRDTFVTAIVVDSPRLRVLEAALIYLDAFLATQGSAA
jgi:hypothetical protein